MNLLVEPYGTLSPKPYRPLVEPKNPNPKARVIEPFKTLTAPRDRAPALSDPSRI